MARFSERRTIDNIRQRRRDDVLAFLTGLGIPTRLSPTEQRRQVLATFFGGCCKRCGFTDMRALQIDHVESDGYKSIGQWTWLLWDISQHPERYQCLCANCNWIKRHENNEHPGRKRTAEHKPDDKFSWVDNWITTEGLRPLSRKPRKQHMPRPQYRDLLARAKVLREADKAARKARRDKAKIEAALRAAPKRMESNAERISEMDLAIDPLGADFMRRQRERLGIADE